MDKKTILTILAILIIPILAFFGLTFKQDTSNVAQASGKPTIIKFTSTMCLECQEINKTFKQIFGNLLTLSQRCGRIGNVR